MKERGFAPLFILVFLTIVIGLGIAVVLVWNGVKPKSSQPVQQTPSASIAFSYRRLVFDGEIMKVGTGLKIDLDFNFFPHNNLIKQEEKQDQDGIKPYVLQARVGDKLIGESQPFGADKCVRDPEEVVCYSNQELYGSFAARSIDNLSEMSENLVILSDGKEILRKERSKNTPIVSLMEEEYDGSKIHLRWVGKDADNDILFYRVYVSQDNFKTLDQVHPSFVGEGEKEAMKKTAFDFNFKEQYFAGGDITFLILVNDGFNIDWTASKTFNLPTPGYQMKVEIIEPIEGEEFGEGFITLNGNLYTLVETPDLLFNGKPYQSVGVPHADLEWISSIDGLLAKYNIDDEDFRGVVYCHAESLTPGTHLITLKGKAAGGEAEASVRIKVKPVPGYEYQGKRPNCS